MTVRVRLAPSPTGKLHIGTARTALFNWLFAKKNKGKFLLRIEDTDKKRSKKEHLDNILDGLRWLGIQWDEEPVIQSLHIKEHQKAIKFLLSEGLAYRCFASEEELQEMRDSQVKQGLPPKYDNRSRGLTQDEAQRYVSEGRSSVIRFRINDSESIRWNDLIRGEMNWSGKDLGGDMVISRPAKGMQIGDPLYNLVVVVDDSAMNITHVIRGEDHISNTAKQLLLYRALQLKEPFFAHTPLILNQEGKKLSKRDDVTSICDFQTMGYTSHALTNYMALLGWSIPEGNSERFKIEEIFDLFSLEKINKSGAKFDWEKLNWLNSQVIHEWPEDYLYKEIKSFWENEGWAIPHEKWGLELSKLLAPSLVTLRDGIDQAKSFFEEPIPDKNAAEHLKNDNSIEILNFIINQLRHSEWDGTDKSIAEELIKKTVSQTKSKKGIIMKTLRSALLGKIQGPDLIITWSLLAQISEDLPRFNKYI